MISSSAWRNRWSFCHLTRMAVEALSDAGARPPESDTGLQRHQPNGYSSTLNSGILRDSAEDFRITPPRDQTITDSSLRGLFPDRDDHPLMLTKGKRLRGLQDATLIGYLDFQCHGFGSRSYGVRCWLRHARRHDSTWREPPWESVPCVVGHGRIIRPPRQIRCEEPSSAKLVEENRFRFLAPFRFLLGDEGNLIWREE